MNEVLKLKSYLAEKRKSSLPVQTVWATVKSVNWEQYTMIATGVVDGVDFHEVQLGLGAIVVKPTVGSKCLLGLIQNNANNSMLLFCEEMESYIILTDVGFKIELTKAMLTLNGDNYGGIVKAPELKTQLDKLSERVDKIITALSTSPTSPSDGGSAYKSAISSQLSGIAKEDFSAIENDKIKHGG